MDIFKCIEKYAQSENNCIALVDDTTAITYKQLSNILKCNQLRLNEKCYKSGDKVILKTSKQLDFIVTFLSLILNECWVIPVPYDITERELREIQELTNGKLFENDDLYLIANIEMGMESKLNQTRMENTGIYHMTSGSTGMPKLCIRTLQALMDEGISFIRTFSITDQDKFLSAAPLYHSFALGAVILPALMSGASIHMINNFVPRKVLRLVEENCITMLILVPTMAKALCETYSKKDYDLSSLRIPLVGAGVITKELFDTFHERFGIYLMSNYGSTETGALISRLEKSPIESVGKAMYGVEIKLCDDSGRIVEEGEEGEIFVRSKGMFKGYYGQDTCTFDIDGFFPMGDIAVYDSQKHIFLKGRKKLMINVGGKKVNPYEVEKIISELAAVKECVVIGIVKPNGKEIVKAFVVSEQANEDKIRTHCESKLSQHKIPSIIELVKVLPKNEVGKVNRQALMKG